MPDLDYEKGESAKRNISKPNVCKNKNKQRKRNPFASKI
jgi:hypothetical protein